MDGRFDAGVEAAARRDSNPRRILDAVVGSDTPVLLGALVALVLLGAAAMTAAYLVWRRVRRRWRALRNHAGLRAAVALAGTVRAGRLGTPPIARLRFELWQSVSMATRAVRGAAEAGAAMADLPALCRRLRAAAEDLDRLLLMATGLDARAPQVGELRRQVAEALDASDAIRLAALASAGDAASARMGTLAADAGREVEAVAAGVARSRVALSGPGR